MWSNLSIYVGKNLRDPVFFAGCFSELIFVFVRQFTWSNLCVSKAIFWITFVFVWPSTWSSLSICAVAFVVVIV